MFAPLGTVARLLAAGVAVLVVLDLLGGLIAIATGVNDASEAWGPQARLAAPWPMILFQVAATAVALARWRRVGAGAAILLAAACLVSAISGFFDGALAAAELAAGHVAFQILLIAWTALVGVVALVHAVSLLRHGPAAPAHVAASQE